MRIAFVNQPIDTILPPYQSSVGACTYGVACSLAQRDDCEVIVYGSKDANKMVAGDEVVQRNVRFRFFPTTAGDRLLQQLRNKYSKFVRLSSPASTSSLHFPAFSRSVAMDLRKRRCDVIHVQHCSQYVPVIRALNPTARIVLHLHAEWFSQNKHAPLERRLRQCDLVTAVSDYVAAKTRRDFPAIADRCVTTYNGIDAAEFQRERDYSETARRSPKRIMYAGAVSPHKGVHVLLEAFKTVVKRYPDVRLDIVGFQGTYGLEETFDMKDRAALASVAPFYARNYVARLKAKLSLAPADAGTYLSYLKAQLSPDVRDKVAFLGLVPRSALLDGYFDADIFAFAPVWDEGFGIPPVEAMAAGTPVVASRSGAIVETVEDQETGFLVDKNDAQGLARSLLTLLEDDSLRERMGRAGRERALKHFTWDGVAETMYGRYRSLCEAVPATGAAISIPKGRSLPAVLKRTNAHHF